ncbi:MAG: regulatory protein RecX, partial [Candidatus Omnitrophica bacterium]|nr:regulatory protein RecX [Candidatus Omnitrophota bacterium]
MGDELKKAKNLAFRLLKYRDRSEKEIVNRLKKKKVSREVIEKVIAELKSLSLLDDRKFAKSWIQERIRKGYGLLKIKVELKEKGIDQDLLEDLLEDINKDEWVLPQIKELAQKRIKKYN